MKFNFMKDVPSMSEVDFNKLQLDARDWKLLAKVDGRNSLEEIRLLAGFSREEADAAFQRLFAAGIVTMRREF